MAKTIKLTEAGIAAMGEVFVSQYGTTGIYADIDSRSGDAYVAWGDDQGAEHESQLAHFEWEAED